jgi:hypothetical protein
MKERMTVVLEYDRREDLPRVGANSRGSDLGNGRVMALQFSDALRELAVLEEDASDEVKDRAHEAAKYVTPDKVAGSTP